MSFHSISLPHFTTRLKRFSLQNLRRPDFRRAGCSTEYRGGFRSGFLARATADPEQATTEDLWNRVNELQKTQPALSMPTAARTVIHNATIGVLSVISSKEKTLGFPKVSVTHFVADENGRPLFSLSDLSSHKRDLLADGRMSLLVTDTDQLSLRSQQVVLTGKTNEVKTNTGELREAYLKKKPGAFYVDFGDFSWFRMEEINEVRYTKDIASNARFSTFSGKNYMETQPDPCFQFLPILREEIVNAKEIVEAVLGHEVESARLSMVDSLGFDFNCTRSKVAPFTCRVGFSQPAKTLEEVRDRLEELITQHKVIKY